MRVAAKDTAAALAALGAYLLTVLPTARRELRRWRQLAEAIPDSGRRQRALASLEEKRSNVEAVAVFATLAPFRHRRAVVRTIVPLQVAIDYRDTLEEANEAVAAAADGYLSALDAGWVREFESLAGCSAVAPLLRAAADRCSEGQRRTHAAAAGNSAELQRWAEGLKGPDEYRWWELAAGASSSVAAHALVAAAADQAASAATAATIDAAYNPSVGALTVLLDDLVDREADRESGEHNYLAYYRDGQETADRLGLIANRAASLVEALPKAERHGAILAGVAAFYLSSPSANTAFAQPVRERMLAEVSAGARVLTACMGVRSAAARSRPR